MDISILIPTFNRAEILRQTLENMTSLCFDGLKVQIVVIDNNSSDHTARIVKDYTNRLAMRYVFESTPGKNCALNRALEDVELGELVVFTDDDVQPQADWLEVIWKTSQKWRDYSVFGGEIFLVMPKTVVSYWDMVRQIPGLAFGDHHYSDAPCSYAKGRYPNGANFWVRRSVFEDGRRFNEAIGPHPTNRIMGSETSFLKKIESDGYRMFYTPESVVGHCIEPEIVTEKALKKRVYRYGRGLAHSRGLPALGFLHRHRLAWYAYRAASLAKGVLSFFCTYLLWSPQNRLLRQLRIIPDISFDVECFKLAQTHSPDSLTDNV